MKRPAENQNPDPEVDSSPAVVSGNGDVVRQMLADMGPDGVPGKPRVKRGGAPIEELEVDTGTAHVESLEVNMVDIDIFVQVIKVDIETGPKDFAHGTMSTIYHVTLRMSKPPGRKKSVTWRIPEACSTIGHLRNAIRQTGRPPIPTRWVDTDRATWRVTKRSDRERWQKIIKVVTMEGTTYLQRLLH